MNKNLKVFFAFVMGVALFMLGAHSAVVKTKVVFGDGTSRVLEENIVDDESDVQKHVYDSAYATNPEWELPKESDYAFYLMSLLDERTSYYVFKDGAYKPIYASSLKLGQLYGMPTANVTLFIKSVVAGKETFNEAVQLKFPNASKDAIFLLKRIDGKPVVAAYDISLKNFPQDSVGILNFSSVRIGYLLGNKKGISEKMRLEVIDLPEKNSGVNKLNKFRFATFDLNSGAAKSPKESCLVFPQGYRYMLVFFEYSDRQSRTPIKIVNQGPRSHINRK